ncbi:cytochrome c biogenesis protein CcsA [Actinospongicola halichondriae]|uniref:cytochrome c biogenesis protein CcsA n=1 Tax=Actinospongicola halichondriae TaxID=3236844 RepID=UPI003D481C72
MTTITTTNDEVRADAPTSTGSRATRILGVLILVGSAVGGYLGLVTSDPDVVQRDAVRLFYVHVPVVSLMYIPVILCTVASVMWLRKRTDGWDALASSSAEVATVFVGLGLVTGALWGEITWGTYWTWDARLTSTALLFLLLVGYLALRRYPAEPAARAKVSAVVGILLVPNAVLVHYSVSWWRSLHQDATRGFDTTMDGNQLSTYAVAQGVFVLILVWLSIHAFRNAWLALQAERGDLDIAIAERMADDDPTGGI